MKKIIITNPYNGVLIDELERTDANETFAILECSYQQHLKGAKLPRYKRIAILQKTAAIIEAKALDLARIASMEGGKPLMDSRVEIKRAVEGIKVAINEISQLTGKEIPMGLTEASSNRIAYTTREPRGVVLAISAFNHPFNLIIHQVIPAIATGCPALVKPSSATPLSCKNLIEILYEAGLPEEHCRMILCENNVTEKLVADRRVSFLTFIGSARVGWDLRSRLAPGATCALEHGGAAPVIIDKTADMELALPLLVKGGYYHAGQVCVSVQRIYVHESILDEFCSGMISLVKKLKVGDPLEEETEVGPLITPEEVDRVHKWVEEAGRTASILCGGKKISNTCYQPTLILNPPEDSMISQKEIFGPVVAIYAYRESEEAINRANQLNYSFQAAVFTKDLEFAMAAVKKLKATAVMVNDHTAFRVDWMPFGGNNESGLGIGGIGPTMREMTMEKLVVIKSAHI